MKLRIETKDIDAKHLLAIGVENNDKAFVTITPDLVLSDAFRLLHTLSLHLLNAYTSGANSGPLPENPTKEQLEKFTAIKHQIYDMYNDAVSSVLQIYAPEFELRPGLTEEAIIRAENEIINERYKEKLKHMSPKEKAELNRQQQALKKAALAHKMFSKSNAKTPKEIEEDATKKVSEVQ